MPLTLGGLGVGGSSKIQHAAHWGSWADCLEMIKQRHPGSAEDIIHGMAVGLGHMKVVEESGARLREMGVITPPWEALAEGLRPQTSDAEREPCQVSHGWQKYAAQTVHEHHRDHVLWPRLSPDQRALVRSQSGPLAFRAIHGIGSSCFAAFVCLCPSLFALAGVAVHSTLLATTAQRAAQLGCLAEEDLQRKMPSRKFAEREGPGCLRTSCSETLTSHLPTEAMHAAWKSSRRV